MAGILPAKTTFANNNALSASDLNDFGAIINLLGEQTQTTQAGTAYTLVLADVTTTILASNAAAKTISIPTDASVAFPLNTIIHVRNTGAGLLTVNAVTPGTTSVSSLGATPASPTVAQGGIVTLRKVAANTWFVNGDVVGTYLTTAANQVLTAPIETANIAAAAPAATQNIDANTSSIWWFTTAAANNAILNFRASATQALDALLVVGQTKTFEVRVTNGATPYYVTAITVDGAANTPKWIGTAPTAGDANAADIYSYAITKTAAATFDVVAQMAKAS